MTIRPLKERILQTASFELIGIAMVSPLYAIVAGTSIGHGLALITLISGIILLWCPLYNTLFDMIDWHHTGRLASERPHGLRMLHAVGHEVSAVLLTCPIIIWIGGHTLSQALAFNLGLTITYSLYAYLFHLAYDQLRPVQALPSKA